jgi:phosphoribosylanthranilate isomerase
MDPAKFDSYSVNLKAVIESVPQVEWIIQLNDETRPLWNLLSVNPPRNMSVLYDASCGKGVVPSSFPPPPSNPDIPCGYAGGIGPDNVAEILTMVGQAAGGKPVWIDMESSLRVAVSDKFVSDQDQFSINKCFACIKVGVQFGMPVTRIALMSI